MRREVPDVFRSPSDKSKRHLWKDWPDDRTRAAALFRGDEIEADTVIVTISGGNVDAEMFVRAMGF